MFECQRLCRLTDLGGDGASLHFGTNGGTAICIDSGDRIVELAVDEYIHIVELRCTKKTKTEIIYEYCADHNNDWGEIRYTPGNNEYDVTHYVYADKKGGFFFAAAGDWIVRQASKEQFPQTAVIPITKI